MKLVQSKKGILLVGLIGVFAFSLMQSGVFGDTRIGITLLSNQSLSDGLVAHYTFDGIFQDVGTFAFGASGVTTTDPTDGFDEAAEAVAIDDSGYLYLVGTTGSTTCGGSGGDLCNYAYKIDPRIGDVLWDDVYDTSDGNDIPQNIVADDDGFVYISGYSGTAGCTNSQGNRCFLTYKLNASDGSTVWSTTTDVSTGPDSARGSTLDNAGNLYVVGEAENEACGGAGTDNCFYTMKIDTSDGSLIWATTTDLTDNAEDEGHEIVSDEAGFIYVSGHMWDDSCSYAYICNITMKLDPENGDVIWASSTDPSSAADLVYATTMGSDGYLYVTGRMGSGSCGNGGTDYCNYTYKVDPADGSMLWGTSTDPSTGDDEPFDITTDDSGFIYITGNADNEVCGGAGTDSCFYTYKVDASDGSLVWATTTDPSTGDDEGQVIAYHPNGYVYVSGFASDEACTAAGGSECHYTFKIDPSDGSLIDTTTTNGVSNIGGVPVSGNIGQAMSFDGVDDHIFIEQSPLTQTITDGFSGFAWIYKDGSGSGYQVPVDWRQGGHFFEFETSNDGQCYIQSTGGGIDQTAQVNIPEDEWVHIGCVYDDTVGGLTYYINGASSTSIASDFDQFLVADPASAAIGVSNQLVNYFQGEVDDVRTYNRPLSAAEVQRLYELGATTKIAKTLDSNQALSRDLEWHITFDGPYIDTDLASEVRDKSENGFHGSFNGVTAANTIGIGVIGQGAQFGGGTNDSIVFGDILDFQSGNDMTIAGWIYPREDSSDEGIIDKMDGSCGWRVMSEGNNNLSFGTRDSGVIEEFFTLNDSFELNEWTHFVITYDGAATARAYFNGVYNNQKTNFTNTICNSSATLDLGMNDLAGNATYNAKYDDFRAYSRVLSDEEILRLYQLGATTKVNVTLDTNPQLKEGLVAHLTFDGGTILPASTTGEFLDQTAFSSNGDLRNFSGNVSDYLLPGIAGQALTLTSGTDYTRINPNATHELSDYTHCAWIYPTADGDREIFSKGGATREMRLAGTAPNIYLRGGATYSGTDGYSESQPGSIRLNEWVHVCFAHDNAGDEQTEIYINGEEISSYASQDTGGASIDSDAGQNFDIGALNGVSRFFVGKIDDVRIYDRVISPAVIKRIYELGN